MAIELVTDFCTAEQRARDMLDRMGVPEAQSYTAVDLVELTDLISHGDAVDAWKSKGERLFNGCGLSVAFSIGVWWADRPWRQRA